MTGYDNLVVNDEGNSTGRAVAETAGETTVKVLEGIALGAAITAGFAGAPVAVVGAVTVGATWLIDKGFEALTGKNAAEFISDTVLDFGSNAISSIGNAVSSSTRSVCKWVGGLFS